MYQFLALNNKTFGLSRVSKISETSKNYNDIYITEKHDIKMGKGSTTQPEYLLEQTDFFG